MSYRTAPTNPPRAGEPPSRRDYYLAFSTRQRAHYVDIYDKFGRLVSSSIGWGSCREAERWAISIIDERIRCRIRRAGGAQ